MFPGKRGGKLELNHTDYDEERHCHDPSISAARRAYETHRRRRDSTVGERKANIVINNSGNLGAVCGRRD